MTACGPVTPDAACKPAFAPPSGAVGVAWLDSAANATDTGVIKMLDPAKHQITLADGKVFETPAGWTFTAYKAGDKVAVTYAVENGKMVASLITKAS